MLPNLILEKASDKHHATPRLKPNVDENDTNLQK